MKTRLTIKGVGLMLGLLTIFLNPQVGQCFYNPSSGKWLSRDPVEEKGGQNIYVFAENNPIAHSDFLGLDVHLWPLNGEVFNHSKHAYVTIEGDWTEISMLHEWDGTTYTLYPWSSWAYWQAIHDPPPMDRFTDVAEPGGTHVLAPGHSSPRDWGSGLTRIVDADFITGASNAPGTYARLQVFAYSDCKYPIDPFPVKVGPTKVHVRDCKTCGGIYIEVSPLSQL
jgi:hypothetical protein